MANFEYQALTANGRLMKGTLEAPSREQAETMLKEMQLAVSELAKAPPARPRGRIGRTEFLLFNQQLASVTKAGIPLVRGLRELARDIQSRSLRKCVISLADDLEAGKSITQAFEARADLFPPLYGQIIKAGVQSGRLSEMLTSLNRHLEVSGQTRRILFEATTYPLVVLALTAVILTAVFRTMIPQFRYIYADMGTNLPGVTRLFLAFGDNVVTFWLAAAAIVAGVAGVLLALARSPAGRRLRERIYVGIPVVGRLYHRCILSRLADSMGLLVSAGCDMPTCLRLAAGASGSELLVRECDGVARRIEQGQNVVEAGQFCSLIPPIFFYSIQLGSQRNELQDNLYGLCDMYTQQTRINQARLEALLLPIMLILVGAVVCLAVLSLFLPIIRMVDVVSS